MVTCAARRYLLLTALIILTSCTGAVAPADPQGNGSAPGVAALLTQGLPSLPEGREASTARVSEVDGNEADFHSVNAIENGTTLDLFSGINELAWGIWQFNPWLESLTSIQVVMSVRDGDEAYIALSNYSRGTWDIEGPLAAGKSVALDEAKHRSSTGNLYVAVLTHGGDEATVHKLVLTTDDGWVIVTVDDSGNVWDQTSLEVINGKPAISYYDGRLKYASSATATGSNASDWSVATVDSSHAVGRYSSLAEVDGQPAISYFDDSNDALKYVRRDYQPLKVWVKVVVDTSDIGEQVGHYTSLAVVNGYPLITYHDAGQDNLCYAWSNSVTGMSESDWQTSISDSQDDVVGEHNSLAVVDGKAAVSYSWSYTVNGLLYKWFSLPATVLVDYPSGQAEFTSLAVANGKPAISWYDTGLHALMYSYSSTPRGTSSNDWSTIILDDTDYAGSNSSLAIIDGRPAISYKRYIPSPSSSRLMLAWSSTLSGDSYLDWNYTVVAENPESAGGTTCLAEVDGKPAISYHEGTFSNLKYAIRMGP